MKIYLLAIALTFSSLIMLSCKKDNPIPPEEQPQLSLALEDTSCTEAWLKLTTTNINLPAEVTLMQDDSITQTINLTSADTMLYVDSLLPNHTYKFHTAIQSYNLSSDSLNVTTMDTTSHNFTFQTWTFGGQAGSCILYDVAIIDENNIWAVGGIYIADTSQNGYTMYNAVHWDGSQWEVKRISVTYNGNLITPPLYGIYAFSATDIWLSSGVPVHGDGINWIQYHLFDMGILGQNDGYLTKIWGGTSNNIYFVGTLGTIAHYQNGQWSRVESGTEMSLVDMTGTSGDNIFICGSDANNVKGIILKKNGSGFETFINSRIVTSQEIFHPDLFGSLPSIWLDEKSTLYAAGNLLYQYKFGKWDYVRSLPENYIGGNPGVYYRGYIADVKGMRSNDMWIVGDRNTLRHFNGLSWKQVGFPYDPESDMGWWTIYPANTCIAVVGDKGNSAIVMLIKK
jgi:hypothetical protein